MIRKPGALQIESSTRCNASCVFCPHKDLKRQGGEMSDSLFLSLADQAEQLGITNVMLFSSSGEPFLFPRLFEWMEELRKRGLKTRIFTNASKLIPRVSQQLLTFSDVVMDITFSLGGIDEDTYLEIMGLDYDTVYTNVATFAKLNKNKIPTVAHIPRMSQTEKFLDKWVEHWRKLFPAQVVGMYNFAGLAKDTLEVRDGDQTKRIPCGRLTHLAPMWDGRVCLCCMDTEGQVILGDLNKESIMDVFNGEKARYYREMHRVGRSNELELCKDCNMNIADKDK